MARLRCKCGYTMILKHGADEGEHRLMKTDTWMELSPSLARSILEVQLWDAGSNEGTTYRREED